MLEIDPEGISFSFDIGGIHRFDFFIELNA
jgi:hypothetical protein